MADTEKEVVLHTKYRFKPENSVDKYVTIHFENSSGDVIVDTNIDNVSIAGETTLTELITTMVAMIKSCAIAPIYDTAKSLSKKDLVLARGQFGIESDTLKIKVGDGKTPWNYLHYAGTNDDDINPEYLQVIPNNSSKIEGSDEYTGVTLDLTALQAAQSAPAGATAYVQILPDAGDVEPVEGE